MRGVYARSLLLVIWCVLLLFAAAKARAMPETGVAESTTVGVSYLGR